ncbi:hypothetical protein [Paraburkholderia ferrariae]|uniref:hypothetical protein n=1 Tax=Paraburkholderia ferrariae TaxID=386056 RepID=UPI000693DA3C|nr:hypothetical protein [Paraburkholderia ferrariae]
MEPSPGTAAPAAGSGDAQVQAVSDDGRRIRQAVVVIHGIGEQRPMDTLRGFVDAVLTDVSGYDTKYRSKPDAMGDLLETRRLQAPASRQEGRPQTDFYEYYWAHHMEGSKYSQVFRWMLWLLFRRPSSVVSALRPAWFASWGLLVFAIVLLVAGSWVDATSGSHLFDWLGKWIFAGGVLTFILQSIASYVVLGYVADAARYLTPNPGNIEARNKIRSEGIKLVRSLHESGKYSRIVIVGHSLGSVIGFDIIRNLWSDLRQPGTPHPQKQPELKAFEQEAAKLDAGPPTRAAIESFQQAQHRLWSEFRAIGVPWLVTDFVTLGSPLTHAQFLMADNEEDFKRRKVQHEYPCCPPAGNDTLGYETRYRIQQGAETIVRSVRVAHHGAPFCCTRWTNLYFPYRRWIFGDLIGGPINGVLGTGVRDVAVVPSTGKRLDGTLLSHVRYWTDGNAAQSAASGSDGTPSLKALRSALRLEFLRGKSARANSGTAP